MEGCVCISATSEKPTDQHFSTCREELYSKTLAGSITTPPLLIVFYKQHSNIDPMWNVRHLGTFETFVVLLPQGVFPGLQLDTLFMIWAFIPLFCSLFFKKNSFAIPPWGLWAWVFLKQLGVSSWTDLLTKAIWFSTNVLFLMWSKVFLPKLLRRADIHSTGETPVQGELFQVMFLMNNTQAEFIWVLSRS